jgi:phage recombination protein Bet
MNVIIKSETRALSSMTEHELIDVLQSSLYPSANPNSIKMVIGYCRAAGLDPMQKPVHIVPMWDKNSKSMRDVVMPGVNLYRTQAMRSGECAGVSEPEFGPDVVTKLAGVDVTFPQWCRVTVKRRLPTGEVVDFTAREFWLENYATAGKDSSAPNAMWKRRPYGQIAKCAEAQALRKAFPEIAAQPTAEEMEGKSMHVVDTPDHQDGAAWTEELIAQAKAASEGGSHAYAAFWKSLSASVRNELVKTDQHAAFKAASLMADEDRTVEDASTKPATQQASKSFEEIMAMLCQATTEDALYVAGDWVNSIADVEQAQMLNDKFDERLAEMRGAQ